jgi:hypothetical protein
VNIRSNPPLLSAHRQAFCSGGKLAGRAKSHSTMIVGPNTADSLQNEWFSDAEMKQRQKCAKVAFRIYPAQKYKALKRGSLSELAAEK